MTYIQHITHKFFGAYVSSSWRSWLLVALLALLLLGWQDFRSARALVVLPWLLLFMLIGQNNRMTIEFLRTLRVPIFICALLSVWILIGELSRGLSPFGIRHALQFLAWIPLALLVVNRLNDDERFLPTLALMLFAHVIFVFAVICWQKWGLRVPRPPGFGHNVLVSTVLFGTFCAYAIVASGKTVLNRTRATLLVGAGITLACAVLSGARTSLVAILVSVAFAALIVRPTIQWRWFMLGPLVLAVWMIQNAERIAAAANDIEALFAGKRHSSLGIRLDAWVWSMDQLGAQSALGIGVQAVQNSFNALLYPGQAPLAWGYKYEHLHNDFLQLLGAYGVPALALYAAFLVNVIAVGLRFCRNGLAAGHRNVWPKFFLICFVASLCITGMLDSLSYWTTTQAAIQSQIALVLGALYFYRRAQAG